MTFGEKLRLAREKLGWSQTELASKIGVKQGAVGNWEGARQGSFDSFTQIAKLCSALNVPLDYFADVLAPGVNLPPPPSLIPTKAEIVHDSGYVLEILGTVAASAVETPVVFNPPKQIHVGLKYAPGTFLLEVDGPSCEPYIPDGSIVVVTPNKDPRDRLFNVVQSGSGYTLKYCQDKQLYRYNSDGSTSLVGLEEGEVVGYVECIILPRPRPDEIMPIRKGKHK